MPSHFSQDQIKKIIDKHFSSCTTIKIKLITTGKFNSSFFVFTDKDRWVLRIAPAENDYFIFYERNMMAQEPELYQIIRDRTSVPVPDIYVYDIDRDIIPNDYLIMEQLPGTPVSDASFLTRSLWDSVLTQVGDFLHQVHTITADQYGYLGAHTPMTPQDTWEEAFAVMWSKMINQLLDIEAYSTSEREFMLKLFENHRNCFQRHVSASLLHMDVWSQNILIDSMGKVTGLLDWDRALWGDPEIEFAVLDYCGISQPAFWRGYSDQRDESPEAKIRFIFYYLYEVQKYIIIRSQRNGTWDQAMQYKRESMSIARQLA